MWLAKSNAQSCLFSTMVWSFSKIALPDIDGSEILDAGCWLLAARFCLFLSQCPHGFLHGLCLDVGMYACPVGDEPEHTRNIHTAWGMRVAPVPLAPSRPNSFFSFFFAASFRVPLLLPSSFSSSPFFSSSPTSFHLLPHLVHLFNCPHFFVPRRPPQERATETRNRLR